MKVLKPGGRKPLQRSEHKATKGRQFVSRAPKATAADGAAEGPIPSGGASRFAHLELDREVRLTGEDKAVCALSGVLGAMGWAVYALWARAKLLRAASARVDGFLGLAVGMAAMGIAYLIAYERRERLRRVSPEEAADSDSQFGTVQGVRVHYKLEEGNNPGRAVSCLHGFGANVFSWEYAGVLKRLADSLNAVVVAYDAPGFGLTERPTYPEKYSLASSTAIARELLGLEEQRAALGGTQDGGVMIGHSLGGLVAGRAAAQGAISAVVLIAPAIVPSALKRGSLPAGLRIVRALCGAAWDAALAFLLFVSRPVVLVALRAMVKRKGFWWRGLRNAWASGDRVDETLVDGYRRPSIVRDWDVGLVRFLRARLAPEGLRRRVGYRLRRAWQGRQGTDRALRGLENLPVLIIHGRQDRLVPVSNSRRLSAELGCELVEIDGCGHSPQEERPDEFVKAACDFLLRAQNGDTQSAGQ